MAVRVGEFVAAFRHEDLGWIIRFAPWGDDLHPGHTLSTGRIAVLVRERVYGQAVGMDVRCPDKSAVRGPVVGIWLERDLWLGTCLLHSGELYRWSEQEKIAARRPTSKLVAWEPQRWTRREGSFVLPTRPAKLATDLVICGAAESYGLTTGPSTSENLPNTGRRAAPTCPMNSLTWSARR